MQDTEVREAWAKSEHSLNERLSPGFVAREPSAEELLATKRHYESPDRALNPPENPFQRARREYGARWGELTVTEQKLAVLYFTQPDQRDYVRSVLWVTEASFA